MSLAEVIFYRLYHVKYSDISLFINSRILIM